MNKLNYISLEPNQHEKEFMQLMEVFRENVYTVAQAYGIPKELLQQPVLGTTYIPLGIFYIKINQIN
jgi:hypothetical protein